MPLRSGRYPDGARSYRERWRKSRPNPGWAKAALLVGCPMLRLAASRQGMTCCEQSARDGDCTHSQSERQRQTE